MPHVSRRRSTVRRTSDSLHRSRRARHQDGCGRQVLSGFKKGRDRYRVERWSRTRPSGIKAQQDVPLGHKMRIYADVAQGRSGHGKYDEAIGSRVLGRCFARASTSTTHNLKTAEVSKQSAGRQNQILPVCRRLTRAFHGVTAARTVRYLRVIRNHVVIMPHGLTSPMRLRKPTLRPTCRARWWPSACTRT